MFRPAANYNLKSKTPYRRPVCFFEEDASYLPAEPGDQPSYLFEAIHLSCIQIYPSIKRETADRGSNCRQHSELLSFRYEYIILFFKYITYQKHRVVLEGNYAYLAKEK
jgi:hypothetical protein